MTAPSSQRGAALLVTLVLVALVTLLAISASQATRLQQQLATNEAARQIAFQAAEAALRAAENIIHGAGELALFCNAASERYNITTQKQLEEDNHWEVLDTLGKEAAFNLYDGEYESLIPPPRYMIGCIAPALVDSYSGIDPVVKGQEEENPERRYFFRVFSVGFGPNGLAEQHLEARYAY